MSRRTLAGLLAVPLLLGLFVVVGTQPLPYVTYRPGPSVDIPAAPDGREIIEVSGHEAYRDDGELRLTTIYVDQPEEDVTLEELMRAWISPSEAVYPYDSVYAPEETDESSDTESAVQMVSSRGCCRRDRADRARLRRRPGDRGPERREGPARRRQAEGARHPGVGRWCGDQVGRRRGAGRRQGAARAAADLRRPSQGHRRHTGHHPARGRGRQADRDHPGPGIHVPVRRLRRHRGEHRRAERRTDVLARHLRHPHPRLVERGEVVAGSGTIDADGRTGPIGGIAQKIAGAEAAGARLFMVAADNCSDTIDLDTGEMRPVRVETMHDAVEAISARADDHDATLPTCEDPA
ncbi:hypothetical protein LP418_18295 [Nocardioides sp. B-3]|nr:hypothetical protein [Nocardioides sp. B-3]UUZ58196.1 hypothetical protein LP418_18295 [Nocardioides sp. B-3]